MEVLVLGAGAWGTALALHAARRVEEVLNTTLPRPTSAAITVGLWARNPTHAQLIQEQKRNTRYLPDHPLPARIKVFSGDPGEAIASSQLVLLASPISGLRTLLQALQAYSGVVAWVCKGFEADTGLLPHEIQATAAPKLRGGSLSGPSFAQEVASGLPCALTIASLHPEVCQVATHYLHDKHMRIYENPDLIGVEAGGAMKNVLAIATGLCDGMHLGMNARAALITRGLAEMTRLGLSLGAKPGTFMGLSGLGDLVLTTTGALSRNRKVGLLLAQGLSVQAAAAQLGHVAEGVYSAQMVLQRAQSLGVEVPITACVAALLQGKIKAKEALTSLMARGAKSEQ